MTAIKVPKSVLLQIDSEKAIEALMDCGGFWQGTKAQFAIKMNWMRGDGQPDRRRVEDMCNYTRDQDELPDRIQTMLGGYVVAYAPNMGGMVMIDPNSELGLDQHLHMLSGDTARQRQYKTENRRRRAIWKRACTAYFNAGDQEMANLCAKADHEIEANGFLTDALHKRIEMVIQSRGAFE